jgi:hypothetical protein
MFSLSQNEYLFIYFILSISHMVLKNICEKIVFSNVVHQMEECKKFASIYLFHNIHKETG